MSHLFWKWNIGYLCTGADHVVSFWLGVLPWNTALLQLRYLSVRPCYIHLKVMHTVLICHMHDTGFYHADVSWGVEILKRNVILIFHFLVNHKSSGILKFLRLGWFEIVIFRDSLLCNADVSEETSFGKWQLLRTKSMG